MPKPLHCVISTHDVWLGKSNKLEQERTGGVVTLIKANGIDLYFERKGEGEPLLFISGSGADLRNKPNQFDALVGANFDLICYDQRGLGQTETPSHDYTMAEYADDAAALLDYLQIDQIPVMGVSFGGMVAQEFALRHPSRIKHMVLACTSSGGVVQVVQLLIHIIGGMFRGVLPALFWGFFRHVYLYIIRKKAIFFLITILLSHMRKKELSK